MKNNKIIKLIKLIKYKNHYESLYNQFEHKKKDNLIPRVKAIGEKIKEESTIRLTLFDPVKEIIDNTDQLNQDLSKFKDRIEGLKKALSNNNEDYSKMIDEIEKNGENFIQEINKLIEKLEKDVRNMELKLKIVKSDHDILTQEPEPTIQLSKHSNLLSKINTL